MVAKRFDRHASHGLLDEVSHCLGRHLYPEVHPQTLGRDGGFVVGTHDGSFWSETVASFILDT